MNTNQLIEKANKAEPSWTKRRPGPVGRWSPLWPVYAELRRKGFTIREAIDWLIREGTVPDKDRQKAEWGLPMVDARRKREAAITSGTYIPRAIKRKKGHKPRRA